jgi:hypothetical protein
MAEQVVYWCHNAQLNMIPQQSMLTFEPKLLLADLLKDRTGHPATYSMCSALRESFGNTYYMENPIDVDVEFTNNGVVGDYSDWIYNKQESFKNRINFEMDYSWMFMSEEPLIMRQSHPFFHKTEFNKHGVLASGSYDIGKWVRSVGPSILLWEGVKTFKAKRGEPISYLEFETDKKIIFKQFYPTQRILDIRQACSSQVFIRKGMSLKEKYEVFANAKLKKVVMKDIKENLLD